MLITKRVDKCNGVASTSEMPIVLMLGCFVSQLNHETYNHGGDDDEGNGDENNLLNTNLTFLSFG